MIEFRWSRSNNPYILAALFAFFMWRLWALMCPEIERYIQALRENEEYLSPLVEAARKEHQGI